MSTDFNFGANDRGDAGTDLGLDEWLSHSTGEGGGDGLVLNWKKSKDENTGELLAWLHTMAPIKVVYRHNWYRVKEIEDRETKAKRLEVYSDRFVSHEPEALLKARKWRYSSKQDRSYPAPLKCPFDRMLELVFTAVQAGHLSWVEPVFAFTGSDGGDRKTHDVVLHAAGIYGGYGEKNMPPNKIIELRKAGIRRDEAWAEDLRPKVAYILSVIDHEHPENGVKLLIEGEALKRAFTKAIGDERKRMRKADDSPVGPNARPYPFLFTYDKTLDFADRYSVTAMSDDLSPQIRELIYSRETIPDLKDFTTPGDPEALLASIEEHALVKLDWGSCFRDLAVTKIQMPAQTKAASAKAEPAAEEEHLFSCEHCGKATMKSSDYACPACGATYIDAQDAEGNPTVALAGRPCGKCKTVIELPRKSPDQVGEKGENVICSSCGTIHHEERLMRTDRPCENPTCKARVALTAGAVCGSCGKTHEYGEEQPVEAPAEVNEWVMVQTAAEPKKAPQRGRAVTVRR